MVTAIQMVVGRVSAGTEQAGMGVAKDAEGHALLWTGYGATVCDGGHRLGTEKILRSPLSGGARSDGGRWGGGFVLLAFAAGPVAVVGTMYG